MTSDTLLFLQNAWSPLYAGSEWPRPSWLRALATSRSGERLKNLIDDLNICHNTTAQVSPNPNTLCKPDMEHVRRLLAERPSIVIACGKQAEAALIEAWDGPLLVVPHPASRLLTTKLYQRGRRLLARGLTERVALRQLRGRTRLEKGI